MFGGGTTSPPSFCVGNVGEVGAYGDTYALVLVFF